MDTCENSCSSDVCGQGTTAWRTGMCGDESQYYCDPACGAMELCGDMIDNNGDGTVNEGCYYPTHGGVRGGVGVPGSGGGGSPCPLVDDSLAVGTLNFRPAPSIDVHYRGLDVPIEFQRQYVSTDFSNAHNSEQSRMARGWFHTYDERLLNGTAGTDQAPTTSSSTIFHAQFAAGRMFSCPGGGAPCATNDGSLDTLSYVAQNGQTPAHWELKSGGGVTTWFNYSGAVGEAGGIWKRLNGRGVGWTAQYGTAGLLGKVVSVVDSLGRQLDLDWTPALDPGAYALTGLHDHASGTVLATFGYDVSFARLTSASSAAGTESYAYASYTMQGTVFNTWYLTTITRSGQAVVQVTYDVQQTGAGFGRVAALADGRSSLSFRGRSDPRNSCAAPTTSVMVVDRSQIAIAGSCTNDVTGDAWCQSNSQTTAACDQSICRPAECLTFGDPVAGADGDRLTAIAGNCLCGGDATIVWTATGSESPRQPSYRVEKDGTTTTYAYDARGRVVAQCTNDNDHVVSTASSSCPAAGAWKSWEYGRADFPGLATKTHERSRLDPNSTHDVTMTYDPTYPELTQLSETGLTRNDVTDANTVETQNTAWSYDSFGRVSQNVLPAGETTTHTYGTQAGYGYGMPGTSERWVNSAGTTRLITSFSTYSPLGLPGLITEPSSVATTVAYDYGGMRVSSITVAGEVTTRSYDAAGRPSEIVEPSGRRTRYSYDSLGHIQYEDVRDSANALAADRVEYVYDSAGRVIQTLQRRLDSSGNPGAPIWQVTSAYDFRGSLATRAYGARSNRVFARDAAGMERVTTFTREDADQATALYDAFGRETEYRRYITGSTSGAYLSTYSQTSGNADADSLPTTITDPHNVARSYTYDDFGRLVKSNSVDYGTLRWGYSAGRLVERRLSNGKRTAYGYDNLGRVILINHDADNPSLVGQDYKFLYDNGDGAFGCGITGNANCTYRKGRLGIVQIEYAPSAFWNLEYGYASDRRVSAELWPSSRQTTYERDSLGRLLRIDYPVQTGDRVRYEYNAVANDGEDPGELSRVVHELTPGVDYLVWARKMTHDARGRLATAYFADREDAAATPSIDIGYSTDGTPSTWRVRRRASGADVAIMDRTFQYWPDGMVKGWSSAVTADPGRTFFYDGANRLTCSTNVTGSGSCPSVGSQNLLESYTYDVHENRLTMATTAGTTTYQDPFANNQLYNEYPPGATVWYGYDVNTFGGRTYDVHQSNPASNQRNYYYYASSQLRAIDMPEPGTAQGTYQNHEFTFLYDHLGRPIYVVDRNLVTSKERRENLYWGPGQLLERVVTPDSTAATTYAVDIFADVDRYTRGWMQLQYVNGAFSSESHRYVAEDATGLPVAVSSFTGVGTSSTAWTADYLPFGAMRASAGTTDPGFGFDGQLRIVGSDARVWNGASIQTLRAPLSLNRWRAYDPRVGRYLQVEPEVWGGTSLVHPFTYVWSRPGSARDPSGTNADDFAECIESCEDILRQGWWECWDAFQPWISPVHEGAFNDCVAILLRWYAFECLPWCTGWAEADNACDRSVPQVPLPLLIPGAPIWLPGEEPVPEPGPTGWIPIPGGA